MTITSTTNRYQYAGNAVTTAFSFPNPFFADADMLVTLYNTSTDAEVSPAPVLNGAGTYDYTVSGTFDSTTGEYTSGANVVFNTAPLATHRVTLERDPSPTQTVVLIDGAKFPAATVNTEFDKLTVLIQRALQLIGQSLQVPSTDPSTVTTPAVIPDAATRAAKYLTFDSNGNPTVTSGQTTTSIALSTFWEGMVTLADAASSRAALFTGDPGPAPQGRLTLTTGIPVMTANVSGATKVYYTPYVGNVVPIYNGSLFVPTQFTELSNTTTASATGSAGPAAVAASSVYDLFVWSNAGTPTLTRGPAWTSATARSLTLTRTKGIWVNSAAITNGPGLGLGTYVGTVRSDGSSQLNWITGGIGSGGTAAFLTVWNTYNRVDVRGLIADSTDTWTYTTNTYRAANASATMRANFVYGLQEDAFSAEYYASASNSTGNVTVYAGVGLDVITAFSGRLNPMLAASAGQNPVFGSADTQSFGFHFYQAVERSTATGTTTWYGDNGVPGVQQSGLRYAGRF